MGQLKIAFASDADKRTGLVRKIYTFYYDDNKALVYDSVSNPYTYVINDNYQTNFLLSTVEHGKKYIMVGITPYMVYTLTREDRFVDVYALFIDPEHKAKRYILTARTSSIMPDNGVLYAVEYTSRSKWQMKRLVKKAIKNLGE